MSDFSSPATPPPPPVPAPPANRRWFTRRILKLPVWTWILIAVVVIASAGSANSGRDTATSQSGDRVDATSDTGITSESTSPASDNSASEPPQSTSSKPPRSTTTLPELRTIGSGTYVVGSEIRPGRYRVTGYWSRLDASMDIIDNDGVYSEGAFTFVEVLPTDTYLEINGEAATVDDFRAYLLARSGTAAYNPILVGANEGTYIVNEDLPPGRYRVEDPDYAYAARLTCGRDIIDNEGNSGSVIIIVDPSDCLFQFSGTLTPLP